MKRITALAPALLGLALAAPVAHGRPAMRGPLPAEQRDLIHHMAQEHESIDRQVEFTDSGYVATTTSDDPELAEVLRAHVAYMKARLDSGAMVRRWDPAFREMVAHHGDLVTTIEKLESGLRMTVTGNTPDAVKVARNHARIVSGFVEEGQVAVAREHATVTDKPSLVIHGGMHEAIAGGEDHARVTIAELVGTKHFFGVGALAGLEGEVTIVNSTAYATGVAPDGGLRVLDPGDAAATMLAGQTVPHWTPVPVDADIPPGGFDDAIRDAAAAHDVDPAEPFAFVVEGDLSDVRLHVIHGACPVHARIRDIELDEDRRPYELRADRVSGTIVGIYAEDAVGKLTHPATRTHAHLVFRDETTGEMVTGHIERAGIAAGAEVRVPHRHSGR